METYALSTPTQGISDPHALAEYSLTWLLMALKLPELTRRVAVTTLLWAMKCRVLRTQGPSSPTSLTAPHSPLLPLGTGP